MKPYQYLLATTAALALTFCTPKEEPTTETEETVVQPVVIEQPAPQNTTVIIEEPVTTTKTEDGTIVKVDRNGVIVKSKDGSSETNVGLSKDSTSFEIRRPK